MKLRFLSGATRWWRQFPLWLLLAVCTAVLYARRPDAFVHPQFWAEDGVFFHADFTLGLPAVVQPYAGYLHLVPRLIAVLGSFLDPGWIPAFYVYSALGLTLYVAARTQSSRLPFSPHAGYALAVVLVPDAPDGLMNLTNLQFILAAGFVLVLISRDPERPLAYVHDVGAALLLGLTGPFSVMFAPFFVVRAWVRRSRASWVLASVVAVTAVVQLWMLVVHPLVLPPDYPHASLDWKYLLVLPGGRIAGSLFAGRFFPAATPVLLGNVLGLGIVGLICCLALQGQARHRIEGLLLGGGCLALVAGTIYRQRHGLELMAQMGYGSRYFYLSQLMVLWLLLRALPASGWTARCALVLLAAFAVTNGTRLREPALADYHWADYVPRIRAGEAVTIPINPAPWKIPLPARRIDGAQ